MCCWEWYTALCCGVWGWVSSWWCQEVWFTIWSTNKNTCLYDALITSIITCSSLFIFTLCSLCSADFAGYGLWASISLFFLFVSNFLPESCLCLLLLHVSWVSTVVFVMHHEPFIDGNRSKVFDSLSVCNKESSLESIWSFWYAQQHFGQLFEGNPEKH